ncbi:MAG TPA: hypothetical protein PLT68_00050 [Actinomycetota bacterium]|nr:hypothetical protein [Actinomycetota bacterium]
MPTISTLLITKRGGPLILRPRFEQPESFSEDLVIRAEGITYDAAAGAFVAGPGDSELELRGVLGDVTWQVEQASGTRTVSFLRRTRVAPDQVQTFEAPLPETVSQPSPLALLTHTSSFRFHGVQLPQPVVGESVVVEVGPSKQILPTSAAQVSAKQLLPLVLKAVLGGWATLAASLVLLAVSWSVGRGLDPGADASRASQVLRAAFGFALVACVGVSLTYVMPAATASLVVAVLALVVIVNGWLKGRLRNLAEDIRASGPLVGWALIPALFMFFPLLFWGATYAGQYKTDLFFYGSLASISEHHSLIQMLSMPEAQQWTPRAGFDYRAIDSVLAAIVSASTPWTTVTALVVVAVALFFLFASASFALAGVLSGAPTAYPIVALALLHPAFVGLFVENYYSQYWFVALIPALVLALHALWRSVPDPRVSPALALWGSAALASAMLAVYPFFFAVIAASLLALALLRREWRTALRSNLWGLLWRTLLITNVSLVTLGGFMGVESASAVRLDEIARYVLLGPYEPAQAIGLLAGTVPFQWRSLEVPASDAMGWPASWIWSQGSAATTVGAADLLVMLALVVIAAVRVDWRATARSWGSATGLALTLGFVVFGAVYLMLGRPYPSLKAFWTAAALTGLIFAVVRWRGGRRWIVVLALLAASVLWVRSAALDRVFWLMDSKSDPVASANMAMATDLREIEHAIATTPGPVAIVYSADQPTPESDQDRNIEAHTQILARDFDRQLVPWYGTLDDGFCAQLPAGTATIVVAGVTDRAELCGRSNVSRSTIAEVFQ